MGEAGERTVQSGGLHKVATQPGIWNLPMLASNLKVTPSTCPTVSRSVNPPGAS